MSIGDLGVLYLMLKSGTSISTNVSKSQNRLDTSDRTSSPDHSTSMNHHPVRKWLVVVAVLSSFSTKVLTQPLSPNSTISTRRPCPDQEGWFSCPDASGICVSPSQVCDGVVDCIEGGWDESEGECEAFECPESAVRCRRDNVCIRVPYRHVCNRE